MIRDFPQGAKYAVYPIEIIALLVIAVIEYRSVDNFPNLSPNVLANLKAFTLSIKLYTALTAVALPIIIMGFFFPAKGHCGIQFRSVGTLYVIWKALIYRLQYCKAKAFDVQEEYQRFSAVINYLVNLVSPVAFAVLLVVTFTTIEFSWNEDAGSCEYTHAMDWTWFVMLLVPLLETCVQVLCLIYLGATLCSANTRQARMTIIRNTVAALAVLGTSLVVHSALAANSRETLSASEDVFCDYLMLDGVLDFVVIMTTGSRAVRESIWFCFVSKQSKQPKQHDENEEDFDDIDESSDDQENAERKHHVPGAASNVELQEFNTQASRASALSAANSRASLFHRQSQPSSRSSLFQQGRSQPSSARNVLEPSRSPRSLPSSSRDALTSLASSAPPNLQNRERAARPARDARASTGHNNGGPAL